MIELSEFKNALGSKVKELSEVEILEIRENQNQMADVFFAMWVDKVKNEN